MKRLAVLALLAGIILTLVPGCGPGRKSSQPDLDRLLSSIPYSFFEKNDIYYGNLEKAKVIYGVEEIDSFAAFEQAPREKGKAFLQASGEVESMYQTWSNHAEQVAPLTGLELFSFDQVMMIGNTPPRMSWVAQGNFNEELILGKLAELGYTRTDYGDYSYMGIRGDFEMDIQDPLGRLVMNSMNRVAFIDDRLIYSPATADVTGVIDAVSGKTKSMAGDKVCQALADSLDDPFMAVFTTADRLITSVPGLEKETVFNFAVPADWGNLHGGDFAAFGYRPDGEKRVFDIALYYQDKSAAEADGKEIIKRMGSYTLALMRPADKVVRFLDIFAPGEPVISEAAGGVILKIPCEFTNMDRFGVLTLIGGNGLPVRDLLFLSPHPQDYINSMYR